MEWTGARYADSPIVTVSTRIAAPAARVWQLVSDITLMPQFSAELEAVEWTDGADRPALGAAFLGHNRHDAIGTWTTRSQIIACDTERELAWAVGKPENPAATWRFRLTPDDAGTELTYTAQLGPARSGLSLAIEAMPEKEQEIVFGRLREFEAGMTATLAGIRQLAESEPAAETG